MKEFYLERTLLERYHQELPQSCVWMSKLKKNHCLQTNSVWIEIRAVEPDFKKSNKKPDAKVGYRRLYPTFAVKAAADVLAG